MNSKQQLYTLCTHSTTEKKELIKIFVKDRKYIDVEKDHDNTCVDLHYLWA